MADKEKQLKDIIAQDVKDLHNLGYAQQLFREMGGFSNFAISFTIISILTGAILLYGYGLKFAGPIINTVGWPIVSVFTLCVAASMAEIASAYPTAGGLYYWAFRLGGKGWAWLTAWMNMIGQITITAGINVAAAIYLIGFITQVLGIDPASEVFAGLHWSDWNFYLLVMILIMIPQVIINIAGIKIVEVMNNFSVYWHIAGVLIIALLLTIFGAHHNDLGFMFSFVNTVNPLDASSVPLVQGGTPAPALVIGPWTIPSPLFSVIPGLVGLYSAAPFILVFGLAFLQAQWTYTGYDASAHMAEETYLARMNSAWGVFLSVAVSAVVGYILMLALTWSITDIAATANDPYPVLYVVRQNLTPLFANLIGVIIAIAMWLCGNGSVTSMARMWFAFSRDGGMPGAGVLGQINHKYRTPVNAILVTSVLAVLITAYSAAYFVVTSISTITLYLAYMFPTYLNWRNKRRNQGEHTSNVNAPWNLKQWGPIINVIAMVWIIIISILFVLPPNELVLWTMVTVGVLLAVYWFGFERSRFKGPRHMTEKELKDVEKEYAV
ncbi:MAG: amino acid permease [Chloroflexi bacterium]|nr:amino acid permease [Chloroflexota bacterium]